MGIRGTQKIGSRVVKTRLMTDCPVPAAYFSLRSRGLGSKLLSRSPATVAGLGVTREGAVAGREPDSASCTKVKTPIHKPTAQTHSNLRLTNAQRPG